MPGEGVDSRALDIALDRYKQGKCPCCGKGSGDSRGMEYRSGPNDLYCHTCRRRWPIEMDLTELRRELALSISVSPVQDAPSAEVFDLAPHCETAEIRAEAKWLRRLLRRFVPLR